MAKKGAATAVKEQVEAVFKAASGELLADGLKKLFGAVITTGGGTVTPAATPTPGAPTASGFDLRAAATELLGPARRTELNAHAAQRVAELNRIAAAHRELDEEG